MTKGLTKKQSKLAKQFSGASWRSRLMRGLVVGLTGLAAIQGVTPETGWLEFATVMKPMVFFPWITSVLIAATTGD